jgi:hypothetical protein
MIDLGYPAMVNTLNTQRVTLVEQCLQDIRSLKRRGKDLAVLAGDQRETHRLELSHSDLGRERVNGMAKKSAMIAEVVDQVGRRDVLSYVALSATGD